MRSVFKYLLLLFSLCNFVNAYSEGGILIFEISDAQNKPVEGLSVEVQKDGTVYKSYATNESGRVVDLSLPAGSYTYSFNFGDLNKGSFEVKDADYTWINLDYRKLLLTFKNDEGTALEGKKATIYKVEADQSETLVGEKFSDAKGEVSFLLPEGDYRYTTFKGSNKVTVKDENINSLISVTSGEITHQTHFAFVNDKGEEMTIYAKDINIVHIAPDSVYRFGSVDAHSDQVSYGYYLYHITENSSSCPAGTYTCSVETKEYGTLKCNFVVDDNDPIENNVVYLVLPTLPNKDEKNEEDEAKKDEVADPDDDDEKPYRLIVKTISAEDSTTMLQGIHVYLSLSERPAERSKYSVTDYKGESVWGVNENTFDIFALNEVVRDFKVESDTIVYFYIDPSRMTKVYFDFYYADEPFNPSSVSSIDIWSWLDSDLEMELYGAFQESDSCYHYERPLILPYGAYNSSFKLDEKDYHKRIYQSFNVKEEDTEVHVETRLMPFWNVDIYLLDMNGYPFESRQYIELIDDGFSSKLVSDSMGHYQGKMLSNSYEFIALGDTQHVDLKSDTVLYFRSTSNIWQDVKFQFLHDGKMVFPQIMSMEVRHQDGSSYSKTVSHAYAEYEGYKNVWVFDEPTRCEEGSYYLEYVLKDYDYNGTFTLDYTIDHPINQDTLIYIVVPVKRSVTITIKDANLNLVTGVYANIYKYDEEGNLSLELEYDNDNHEGIRTNSNGNVIDHLVPGRYQLRILDIKRDFIVSDYDLAFDIISGTKMYDVKYVVQYISSKAPVEGLLLDITKEGAFYNTTYTNASGIVEIFCEAGNYAYDLHYGEGHNGSYALKSDTTIYIYLEDPVMVSSLEILGCACVPHNDTVEIALSILPENATLKEVEWSVDNEVMAHLTSDGKLVTSQIMTDGFVTVTARAKDAGAVVTTKRFYISNDNCGPDIQLNFSATEDKEMPLMSDKVELRVKFSAADELGHTFIYQVSYDSTTWATLYGPTQDTVATVAAAAFTKDALIRVLASATEKDVVEYAKSGLSDCGSDKMSDTLSLRINHLIPLQWPDSICASTKEITLSVNTEELGTLAEGYTIVWYAQPAAADTFQKLDADGETTITVSIDSTTAYKAAVQKGEVVSAFVQQSVFVEQLLDFDMAVDRDTVCLGDTVRFSTQITAGEAGGYWWSDSTTASSATMRAAEGIYVVTVTPKYHLCPSVSDTMRLTIDTPVDFTLSIDREVMCISDTAGVNVRINMITNPLSDTIAQALWSDSSHGVLYHDVPQKSTTYNAVVSSQYGRCPSMSKEISVKVNELLSLSVDADAVDICQYGTDSVTLTAQTTSGVETAYVWWNGQRTTSNTMTFVPQENVTPWVYIEDGVCPDSERDSIDIKVAKPSSVTISSTNKVFEYRSDINLLATTSSFVYGPYSWYSIDAEQVEHKLSETEEAQTADLPDGDISYYVLVENGACPEILSDTISLHLSDNIVIPTIFTPYTVDGQNDDFMPGYPVIIYDRYGDIITNSENGWDGYYRGKLADPGVYYYVLTLKDERVVKGTIELFRKK